jgi:peptide deformylase
MSKIVKYKNGNLIEYEILKLVDFYDPVLRKPTVLFDFNAYNASREADYIAYSLAESMNHYGGLGLSANQCGINKRVCTINMGKEAWVMFNPQIIEKSEKTADFSEGCLSYPGLYVKIGRSDHIKVRFQALGGQTVEHEFDGLTAVCIQHELDHLDGIVYTDRISPINLEKAKRKVKTNLKKMARIKAA